MASTPTDGSVITDPTSSSPHVANANKETAAPLSASAMSFNPNATASNGGNELLSPSAVLWGITSSQSYAGAPQPQDQAKNSPITGEYNNGVNSGVSTPGSAPHSNAGTPSKNMNSSSSTTANTSGATQGGDSLGGLWNFGGFDVDALTNDNRQQHQPNHQRGGGGPNNNQDLSGLSSAFGNFGLQQGGGGQPPQNRYGGNKYGGGAPQSGKPPLCLLQFDMFVYFIYSWFNCYFNNI